jgi:hypothetical protein
MRGLKDTFRVLLVACGLGLNAYSQPTISTGSIQGDVTDPSSRPVRNVIVSITGKATGQRIRTLTRSSGTYHSGALIPGAYLVRVEAPNFRTTELGITVQVGITSTGNVRLEIGAPSQVVEVQASPIGIDLVQATVQGVMTAQQIDRLPINGRNFLDLAQLEPGVQIQDGANFDPTKIGYSSISFGGRSGRAARISVDGVDVSDENVGTTTQNIPSSGIQEFQLSQSDLDLSGDLTSFGAVSIVTRAGSNDYHGELFYLIRDRRFGLPAKSVRRTPGRPHHKEQTLFLCRLRAHETGFFRAGPVRRAIPELLGRLQFSVPGEHAFSASGLAGDKEPAPVLPVQLFQ